MKTKSLIFTLAALALACAPETLPEADAPEREEQEVQIGVDVRIEGGSRSCVGAGESEIKDITVFQFRMDGSLYRDYCFESPELDVKVSGKAGAEYRFCAVMNMGDKRGSIPDISGLSGFRYSLTSMRELDSGKGMPMSSPVQEVDFGNGSPRISMTFTRLVTCVDFRLKTDSVFSGEFTVRSVSVRQAAASVLPFVSGSRAGSAADVFDGDCALASDLDRVARGEEIRLYCLENCQGDLLNGNTDPRAKLPSAIGTCSDVCTYLEVKADYRRYDNSMTSSNIYRMYLGKDNCSNFDLERNTVNRISLSLSDWSGAENYWKAEWDVIFAVLPEVTLDVDDVEVGGTVQAKASACFVDGSTDCDPTHFEWNCEGPVTVSSSGLVSGLGNGNFTLSARYLRAPVEASACARSQEFADCELIFGGFYDIVGIEEDLSGEPGVRFEDGLVTVTMNDDFGHSVHCTCEFTVGIIGHGPSARYVSFESGLSHSGSGKIVNGGYVVQSVESTHGTAFMAPGSEIPIYLKDKSSLISEEVGIAF